MGTKIIDGNLEVLGNISKNGVEVQEKISSTNKLNADLVDDSSSTHKFATASDLSKLAGIEAGAEVNVNADWNASSGDAQILNKPNLATVATSGDYNDLTNKPTIPTDTNQKIKQGNVTFGNDDVINFVGGSHVTVSGDSSAKTMTLGVESGYSIPSNSDQTSWTNKQDALQTQTAYTTKGSATKVPQITTNSLGQVTGITEVTITQPSVYDGTLTIQKNGTTVATFTANQSTNETANIIVPTTLDEIADGSTRKLSNYLPLSGGTMTDGSISWNSDSHGVYFYNGCGIEKWNGYGPALVTEGASTDFWIRQGSDRSVNYKIIHEGNIGSQSVSNADTVDGLHASDFVKYGGDVTYLGVNSPASTAKDYWADTSYLANGDTKMWYNHNGVEYSILMAKAASGAYGSILRWGYADTYLRILRINGNTWQSDDWEKMSAGYADSAGNADTVDGEHASRFGWIYNSNDIGDSGTASVNDMVTSGVSNATFGMFNSATDNPTGNSSWVHVWSQQWNRSSTSWVSQIAIGAANGTGMWYRTNGNNTIVGKAWTRLLDSSNYSSYALPLSGGTMTGAIQFGDWQHRISQEDGTTITRAGGGTINVPALSGNSKGMALLTDEGGDYGLLYVGSDGALIANSADTGYVLTVNDKDTGTNIFRVCQTNGTSEFNSKLNVNDTFTATNAHITGSAQIDGAITNLAVNSGIYWNPYVESSSDGSDAASITVLSNGCAGGTELRISQQNDWNDVINLVTNEFIYMNGKQAFDISDSWLRINANLGFSSGIYTGSSLVRTDNAFQAGSSGNFWANASGQGYLDSYMQVKNCKMQYNTSEDCLDFIFV